MGYPNPNILKLAQWLKSKPFLCERRALGSNPADVTNIFWISDTGMDSDVNIGTFSDIGMTVLSPKYFLPKNNRCRCRISDIADIKIDVDAHLW